MAGYSLIELMFALGLSATLSAMAIPQALASLDDHRAASAARYLSMRLQQARVEAIARSASCGVRISRDGAAFTFTVFADGNGNGVLSKDIQTGVDPRIAAVERLNDQFPGADFGALPSLPAVDASSTAPGTDPVRVGASDTVVFTSAGTATPGSLYLKSQRGAQYAVRVFGETGRVRVLKFNERSRTWTSISG